MSLSTFDVRFSDIRFSVFNPPRAEMYGLPTPPVRQDITFGPIIERGIKLLTDNDPRWFHKINPSLLAIESGRFCVLGQIYGSFDIGLQVLGIVGLNASAQYGFALSEDLMYPGCPYWMMLNQQWIAAIARLKEEDKAKQKSEEEDHDYTYDQARRHVEYMQGLRMKEATSYLRASTFSLITTDGIWDFADTSPLLPSIQEPVLSR